jgi:hypothetical protein
MNVTRVTAMIVANRDDLRYSWARSTDGGYSGWIMMPNGRPLISTRTEFTNAQAAICCVYEARDEFRKHYCLE